MSEFTSRETKNLLAGLANAPKPVCPECGHAPIMHDEQIGCIPCFWLVAHPDVVVPNKPKEVCKVQFKFKLSRNEREMAKIADPTAFEQDEICAECGMYWMQHHGYLCPSGDSTFIKLFPKGKEQA